MSSDNEFMVIEESPRPYIANVYIDYLLLPDRELKILLALKSYAWNNKSDCFPSIASLSTRSNKKRSQVIEIIKILEIKGLIRIEKKPGSVNVYYITNAIISDELLISKTVSQQKKSDHSPQKVIHNPSGNPDTTRPEIRTTTRPEIRTLSNKSINNKNEYKKTLSMRTCPLDFSPNERHYRLGLECGVNVDEQIPIFIDYYHSRGKKLSDWGRTFNNWIRREHKFNKQGRNHYANRSKNKSENFNRMCKESYDGRQIGK